MRGVCRCNVGCQSAVLPARSLARVNSHPIVASRRSGGIQRPALIPRARRSSINYWRLPWRSRNQRQFRRALLLLLLLLPCTAVAVDPTSDNRVNYSSCKDQRWRHVIYVALARSASGPHTARATQRSDHRQRRASTTVRRARQAECQLLIKFDPSSIDIIVAIDWSRVPGMRRTPYPPPRVQRGRN